VVTTSGITAQKNQTLALSSLFMVSDADGDAMTRYQLRDLTADPASGHFVVGGVTQAAGAVIEISAGQLAQTSFVSGTVGDNLQIRAFDGTTWSAADNVAWSSFMVSPPANRAPVVTTKNVTAPAGQSLAVSSLFTVSDADGDTMTKYQLRDLTTDAASGHFVVAGAAKAAGAVIEITAGQLAQASFVSGTVGDNLQIRAFDGTAWSAADNASWSPFRIAPPINHAPVVAGGTVFALAGQSLAASSLFSASDPDGDAITEYQFMDITRPSISGHFVVNGAAQDAGMVIDIPASQLSQTSFLTGMLGDSVQVRVFDGKSWSNDGNWSQIHIVSR
jgi:hypothetical protein